MSPPTFFLSRKQRIERNNKISSFASHLVLVQAIAHILLGLQLLKLYLLPATIDVIPPMEDIGIVVSFLIPVMVHVWFLYQAARLYFEYFYLSFVGGMRSQRWSEPHDLETAKPEVDDTKGYISREQLDKFCPREFTIRRNIKTNAGFLLMMILHLVLCGNSFRAAVSIIPKSPLCTAILEYVVLALGTITNPVTRFLGWDVAPFGSLPRTTH